ncbi:MAG: hypothetical protein M3Y72_07110 [Acidobacteriota bacterium]|nr:hypothetical protein [Acidobacteriota bacterium]
MKIGRVSILLAVLARSVLGVEGHKPASEPAHSAVEANADSDFEWKLLTPPVWNLAGSRVAEIPIVVRASPATGIRLLQSTLTRQGLGPLSLRAEDMELCGNADGKCTELGTIGPISSRTLYLRMKQAADGVYTGNVVIRCDQRPAGETVPLTVNVTSFLARVWGVASIALGVVLYFLATVVARSRLAGNSRWETALLLLEQVEDEKAHVAHTLAPQPDWMQQQIAAAFSDIEDRLSRRALDPYMPGLLDPDAKTSEFKIYLQAVGLRLESLHVVLEAGMPEIARWWTAAGSDTAKQQVLKEAADKLLAIPDGQISAADTKTRVNALLAELKKALGPSEFAPLTLPDVRMQLQQVWISSVRWTWLVVAVWLAATVLTGWMVMVLSKPGFGTPEDFGLCLLWGLGLPVAGNQLNQLSVSDVGSKIGITLPKA